MKEAKAKAKALRQEASKKYNSAKTDKERAAAYQSVLAADRSLRALKKKSQPPPRNGALSAPKLQALMNPGNRAAAAANKGLKEARRGGTGVVRSEKVSRYLKALSDPWEGRGVACPFSHNNEPSVRATTATTTANFQTIVPYNTAVQIAVFPGHANPFENNPIDPSSFHGGAVGRAGTADVIVPGPCPVTGSTASGCVWLTNQVVVGGVTTTLGNGQTTEDITAGSYLQSWDLALPYTGTTALGHTRWQLVSMSIKIMNIAPIQNRAGNVITVQKTNNDYIGSGLIDQDAFAKYPSYRDWGCNDVEINRSFRSEDIAMLHCPSGALTTAQCENDFSAASLRVFINGSPSYNTNQQYSISCIFNWMLAGELFGTVAVPIVTQPSTIMDSVTSIMQNFFPTGHKASDVYNYILEKGFDHVMDFVDRYGRGDSPHDYALLRQIPNL